MYHAEEDVARLVVFLLEISLRQPIEGFPLALKMRADAARRLNNGQAVIVFVQDFERGRGFVTER